MARQSDFAFQAIHRAIVRCDLAPGAVVTELQLAERYGLKRAATRTALERLAMMKLMQPARRLGYVIRPITLRDVIDSIQMLEILMLAVCRMVADEVDVAELRRLDEICAGGYDPNDSGSIAAFLDAESRLYVSVAKATGNVRLVAMLEQLVQEIQRVFHFGLKFGGARDLVMGHQHREFIEALVRGDRDAAVAVMKQHLERSTALIMKSLMSSDKLLDVSISG